MRWTSRVRSLRGLREQGAALMLVLFVCLAVAVSIQALSTVLLCAERAAVEEAVGRSDARERDQGLAAVRLEAVASWRPQPWVAVTEAPNGVEARTSDLDGGLGWVMQAEVRQASQLSRIVVSAWLERGRDGIDLPLAALVAQRIVMDPDRVSPWLDEEGSQSGTPAEAAAEIIPRAYLRELPSVPGPGDGCLVTELSGEWRLDDGWRLLGSGSTGLEPGVVSLTAGPGETVTLPEDHQGEDAGAPLLAVVTGGGDLDLRELGDLYGVVVVDGGSLLLEGTVLHGAAFVTGSLTLGGRGLLRYSQPLLRWATDRSLRRVRLVPGSRLETTE